MIFLLLEKKVVIYLQLVNQKSYRFIIGASLTALSHIYTIQRINVNKNKKLRYPPDRDLSGGYLCLPFEEPEPGLYPFIYMSLVSW